MPMQKAILGMMSVASNMLAQTVANSTIPANSSAHHVLVLQYFLWWNDKRKGARLTRLP